MVLTLTISEVTQLDEFEVLKFECCWSKAHLSSELVVPSDELRRLDWTG